MAARTDYLRPVPGNKKQQKKRAAARKQDSTEKKEKIFKRLFVQEWDYYDYNLLAVVILLTCFGLIMLYSTTAYRFSMGYFVKQAVISAVGLAGVLFISSIDYHIVANYAEIWYAASLILLTATQIIGREVNGAKRWIYVGPISFQPAEFAKLALILFMAALVVQMGYRVKGLKATAFLLLPGILSGCFAYLFTENLSTGLIMVGISVGMIFVIHPKSKPFFYLAGAGAGLFAVLMAALPVIVSKSDSFRFGRLKVWINPEKYASEGGYQVVQALYAIGSGGFLGKGLGNSTQKLGALPEAQNDMIFSIICEELGLFGAALLMLLFVFMLYRLFFIAQNAPDLLGSMIAVGIFMHIALQVVLNIAVVTNLLPPTGITLPFVSYGGSSIVFLMTEMGLALSVSRKIEFR